MNDCLSAIFERRSVRKFLQTPIDDETVNYILKAAVNAPSSMNRQARHYAVFQGRSAVDSLNDMVKKCTARMPNNPYYKSVTNDSYSIHFQAPLFIIVMANPSVTSSPQADCATALQNMFVAARSLGIGSCWINQLNPLHEEEGFQEYMKSLGIPEGFAIYGCGAFGFPDGDWPNEPKRKEHCVAWIKK